MKRLKRALTCKDFIHPPNHRLPRQMPCAQRIAIMKWLPNLMPFYHPCLHTCPHPLQHSTLSKSSPPGVDAAVEHPRWLQGAGTRIRTRVLHNSSCSQLGRAKKDGSH
ncbi:hypothetical protein HBI56_095360 [Parastagonospora nodorum]|nr:hypothetical protein HBH52_017960 [Parastagonospora nodorum]KAH4110162.1 hypothetical protein HBH46_016690 [Parastagonospora nodorum]KAH4120484.1 hypothetical protein HBH47_111990 [Parastagonospora nodorum]KAH4214982.1 hypothetical protein HBI95_015460 [Parastagonospora nodorum]KAH4261077.1 hypothetical protein HBI03_121430 [Parastagonospora nodorum]